MDESVVKHLDAPAKVLKLSEAIRIGAKIRPQCFGSLWSGGGSCALGAAAEGAGFAYGEDISRPDFWAVFQQAREPYEILEVLISRWNDKNNLSREEIADRLEAMGY